eukprot:6085448-Pyramimonas_sp.AAC.1
MAFSHPRRRAGSRLIARGPRQVTRWPGRQNAGSQHAHLSANSKGSLEPSFVLDAGPHMGQSAEFSIMTIQIVTRLAPCQ